MGKISDKKAEELEALLNKEENEIKSRLREIKLEETNLHKEENKLLNTKEVIIDYDNITDKKERYDIVHSVIDKIILRRESRYILVCSIYNKINDNIKEITIDTYNKKVIE